MGKKIKYTFLWLMGSGFSVFNIAKCTNNCKVVLIRCLKKVTIHGYNKGKIKSSQNQPTSKFVNFPVASVYRN